MLERGIITTLWSVLLRTFNSILRNQLPDGLIHDLSPSCKTYLTGLAERALARNFNEIDLQMINYSGSFFNELGMYRTCASKTNMVYYLVQGGADFVRLNIGFCFTDQCSDEDVTIVRNFMYTKMKLLFSQPGNYFYKMTNYLVVNVTKVENFTKSLVPDPLAAIFYFLIFSFLLITTIITLTNKWKQTGKRPQIKATTRSDLTLPKSSSKLRIPISNFEDSAKLAKSVSLAGAFDIRENWKRISDYKVTSPEQLSIDVLRTFSYFAVNVSTYAFIHCLISKIYFDEYKLNYYLHAYHQTIVQSSLFVPDLLLFIGGFTGTAAVLRVLERKKAVEKRLMLIPMYLLMLCKRFFRYTVGMFLVMTYMWKILPTIATGPLSVSDMGCTKTNFFETLLLFNNTFAGDGKRMCNPWLWYPAADFQLFLIVPFICMLFTFCPKVGMAYSWLLTMLGLGVTFLYNQWNSIKAVNDHDATWITSCMTVSYARSFCYYLGCSVSLVQYYRHKVSLSETPKQIQPASSHDMTQPEPTVPQQAKPRNKLYIFMIVSGLVIFAIDGFIFQNYMKADRLTLGYPQWMHSTFNTFGPSGFAISVVLVFSGLIYRFYSYAHIISKSLVFKVLRAIYFEVFLVTVPFLVTIQFCLQSITGFDAGFDYAAIIWELATAIFISLFLHIMISKPYKNCLDKLFRIYPA